MANSDSDDYELMPSHELDDLRHEVSLLKKNSMTEGDKARMLIESMDRLTVSINRFVTILNDAQKDIIDEYQESKPTEKLNQLLEQSETIAKVLISMNDNLNGSSSNNSGSRNPLPPSSNYSAPQVQNPAPQAYPTQNYPPQGYPQQQPQGYSSPYSPGSPFNNMPPMSQQNTGMMNDPRNPLPIPVPPSMGPQSMNPQQRSFNPSMSMDQSSISLGDDFPPMEDIPPLEGPSSNVPKKKFLGIM